jgi:hypothetical protein
MAMKRWVGILGIVMALMVSAWASPKPNATKTDKVPVFPGTLANARYVYVACYDGDQFNTNILPEDREAISAVQDSLQKWGKLILVYEPAQADIVILVQSRPSEDVLAVYDAHLFPGGNYLWRVMGRSGLQSSETPLVSQFEKGFESVQKK